MAIAILRVFGPNGKGSTLMISKSKKHDIKYVKILAEGVIKPLVDAFISGEGWNNLLVRIDSNTKPKPYSCKVCEKSFATDKTLSNHIKKFHSC